MTLTTNAYRFRGEFGSDLCAAWCPIDLRWHIHGAADGPRCHGGRGKPAHECEIRVTGDAPDAVLDELERWPQRSPADLGLVGLAP